MKPPLEKEIQRACLQYLKILENQGRLMAWRANAGMMFGEYKGKKWAAKLGEAGQPDIFCWYAGWLWALEIKREKGKMSDSQIAWQKKAEKLGVRYHIIRSVDELKEIIK